MGQAKRRKELGLYPNQTPKNPPKTRTNDLSAGYGDDGVMMAMALLLGARRYPKLPKEIRDQEGSHENQKETR